MAAETLLLLAWRSTLHGQPLSACLRQLATAAAPHKRPGQATTTPTHTASSAPPPNNPVTLKPVNPNNLGKLQLSMQQIQEARSLAEVYHPLHGMESYPAPIISAALARLAQLSSHATSAGGGPTSASVGSSTSVSAGGGSTSVLDGGSMSKDAAIQPSSGDGGDSIASHSGAAAAAATKAKGGRAWARPQQQAAGGFEGAIVRRAAQNMDLLLHTYTGPQLVACVEGLCHAGQHGLVNRCLALLLDHDASLLRAEDPATAVRVAHALHTLETNNMPLEPASQSQWEALAGVLMAAGRQGVKDEAVVVRAQGALGWAAGRYMESKVLPSALTAWS